MEVPTRCRRVFGRTVRGAAGEVGAVVAEGQRHVASGLDSTHRDAAARAPGPLPHWNDA